MKNNRWYGTPPVLLLLFTGASTTTMAQQPLVAKDVIKWASKGPKNPSLDDHKGDLTYDDAAKKLSFASGKQSFETSYDEVRRIVLDEATHMRPRRMGLSQIGEQVKRVHGDYWMYMEHAGPGGTLAKVMLQIPRECATEVLEKTKKIFADRVVVTDVRVGVLVNQKTLKDIGSKHTFQLAEQKNHPLPELKPDKALIVVVYPLYKAGDGSLLFSKIKTHKAGETFASQAKIHANDEVVLVNKVGTYGFAYLAPGDYQLAVQASGIQASVLQTKLESGKAYYFLEDDYSGSFNPGFEVQLSQHSPELVMHKLGEAYLSIWTRKPNKSK
ncbi:MAG: hypothetical protein HZB13_06010 [Acidobacteria bacterium]|nr:hypothetical protein [Acidobacteriota bacterium]